MEARLQQWCALETSCSSPRSLLYTWWLLGAIQPGWAWTARCQSNRFRVSVMTRAGPTHCLPWNLMDVETKCCRALPFRLERSSSEGTVRSSRAVVCSKILPTSVMCKPALFQTCFSFWLFNFRPASVMGCFSSNLDPIRLMMPYIVP